MKFLIGFVSLCLTTIAIVYIVHSTPESASNGTADSEVGVLTVSASHSESFSPTNVRYSLRFEKRNANKNALTEASRQANAELIEFVSTLNVPEDSVVSERFSLEKAWKWENNKRQADGFEISQNISVNIPDPQKASAFIEGISTIQDLEIVNASPEISDESSKKNRVYRAAIEEATEKATALAKASGKKLGKVLFVGDENASVESFDGALYTTNAGLLGASRMRANIVPQQKVEISASISMKFKIK